MNSVLSDLQHSQRRAEVALLQPLAQQFSRIITLRNGGKPMLTWAIS